MYSKARQLRGMVKCGGVHSYISLQHIFIYKAGVRTRHVVLVHVGMGRIDMHHYLNIMFMTFIRVCRDVFIHVRIAQSLLYSGVTWLTVPLLFLPIYHVILQVPRLDWGLTEEVVYYTYYFGRISQHIYSCTFILMMQRTLISRSCIRKHWYVLVLVRV